VLFVLQVIEDDVSVEQFSGAMTNMVYRCGLLQGGREVQVGTSSLLLTNGNRAGRGWVMRVWHSSSGRTRL
jgi:hypothetical protein